MDPITQNVNANIDEYIQSLASECLNSPGVAALSPQQKEEFERQVKDYLYKTAFEVLVEKMTDEQFKQIENLDPKGREMIEKIQLFSAQVPGLAQVLETRFKQDVEYIKQSGNLPASSFSS